MSDPIDALTDLVAQHGREILDDSDALAAALLDLPRPLPDADAAALLDAADQGVARRIRVEVGAGAAAEQALDAVAPPGVGDGRARWAAAQLGAALGLLPRTLAGDPDHTRQVDVSTATTGSGLAGPPPGAAPTTPPPTTVPPAASPHDPQAETVDLRATAVVRGPRGRHRRRRRWLPVLAVAVGVLLVAGVIGALLLARGDSPTADADAAPSGTTAPATSVPPSASAPLSAPGSAPSSATSTAPAAPADPRAAFTDPILLAAAEPYLNRPDTTCTRDDAPPVTLRESVTCRFGTINSGGTFNRHFDPAELVGLRDLMGNDETAVPGSRRILRWEYVADRPGVRTGIPVGAGRPGAGTRVRWLGLDPPVPLLYFDEDATGVSANLLLTDGDQNDLRRLWADPNG